VLARVMGKPSVKNWVPNPPGSMRIPYIFVREEKEKMDKYVCRVCGYVYDPAKGDPDNGIEPETRFEDLPEDWVCPLCGAAKDMFEKKGG